MKFTIFLAATFVLMVCLLFAGCTSPQRQGSNPRDNCAGTASGNNISINRHARIDATISGNTSLRTIIGIHFEKQRPDASIHLLFNGFYF
jgi:hypothetical protein